MNIGQRTLISRTVEFISRDLVTVETYSREINGTRYEFTYSIRTHDVPGIGHVTLTEVAAWHPELESDTGEPLHWFH